VRSGKKTYRYLTLAESFRNEDGQPRSRIVARLGEVSEMTTSGELERIVDALSAQMGRGASLELTAESAPSYGAMAACDAYFSRLSLDELFDTLGARRRSAGLSDAVFAMVANRLSDPSSKRRCVTDWLGADAALPKARSAVSLDRLYRALDAVADCKDEIEAHCYTELCNLANLDLRLVCYDLTSIYFEGDERASARFPSKALGYSRDHRGDGPQIVIGLLVTSDGIPIAHHVFSGNTADRSTLAEVMADLQARFGVGRIALMADRGLISEENLALVAERGFDHVLATRLHRDPWAPRSWRKPPTRTPSSCRSLTTGPERPRSSASPAVMSWSTRRTATCETTGDVRSFSPRPRTASWPLQTGCVRAGSSMRPRSAPPPTGSFESRGSPVAFRPRSPTGCSPGTTTRRPWTTRRGSSPAAT